MILKRTQGWTGSLLEVFLVFLSISAAFMLENWRETRHHQKLEAQYLADFLVEIGHNQEQLQELQGLYQASLKQLDGYQIPAEKNQLEPLPMAFFIVSRFHPEKTVYQSMLASGAMRFISRHELRKELVAYYQLCEQVGLIEKIFQDYANTYVFPFVMAHFDLGNAQPLQESIIDFARMKNVTVGLQNLIKQNTQSYAQLLDAGRALETSLRLASP